MGHYPVILLIVFCGAFTQGLTGFGSALVAMPLLVLFVDIHTAVALCVLNGLVITSFLSLQLKSHLDWQKIRPLLIGCLPGVVVGTLFLKNARESLFFLLLGLLLILYSLYRLFLKPEPRKLAGSWGIVAGFLTGTISGAFSAGGPPTIIYTTLTGWTKHEIKANLSLFFFMGGILTVLSHLLSGITTVEVFKLFVYDLPAVVVGVWSGSLLYRRFATEGYIRLVLIGLLLMGVVMLHTALSPLWQ